MRGAVVVGGIALLLGLLAVWAVQDVLAQPSIPHAGQVPVKLQPAEVETISCQWDRTLVSGTATLTRRGAATHPDSVPNGMISAGPVAAGNQLKVTLAPNLGCGTVGCRAGNAYQLTMQATDSDGNQPICDVLVKVAPVVLQP